MSSVIVCQECVRFAINYELIISRKEHTILLLLCNILKEAGVYFKLVSREQRFQFKRRRSNRISLEIPSFTMALHPQRHASCAIALQETSGILRKTPLGVPVNWRVLQEWM